MAKPSIANIQTDQTFQNWFDKTNELVDLFRDQALTATGTGDTTIGIATLVGDFTANTVNAVDIVTTDLLRSYTAGATIQSDSPIKIVSSNSKIAATFQFNASGAQTRYTTGTASWDIGMDNATEQNFVINNGAGGQFKLSPAGVLTVPSLISDADVSISTDLTIAGHLEANTANFGSANGSFTGVYSGDFTGDIYHPDPLGGNGRGKVLENGGPNAAIPATFYGNVNGTVSSLVNQNTNKLKEGTDNSVGESTPGAKDGGNNLYFTNSRVWNSLTAGTGVTINKTTGRISIGQSVSTAANVSFGDGTGNAITADGDIVASGNITAYGSISDMTMKENITPIENALEKVSQLGGYIFNYKGDDQQMTGVMAQELKDVLPGVVYETTDPKTKEPIYAVRHGNIIGLLIEAIKELQEKVGK